MRSLYEIEGDWRTLDEMLDASGGEITPEIEAFTGRIMEDLEDETERKLENYCRYFRSEEQIIEAHKREAEYHWDRSQNRRQKLEWLQQRVFDFIKRFKPDGIQAGVFALSIRKNGGSQKLEIDCKPEELPREYIKETISYAPNREKIVADIKAGKEISFARLLPRGERLNIS